tara:strand:+ start:177 stop:2288 length:2112 start_codon:yes stop_codon:yes gene_type:complete
MFPAPGTSAWWAPNRDDSLVPGTKGWWLTDTPSHSRQQGETESSDDDDSMRIKAVRKQIQSEIAKEIEWTNFYHVHGAQIINDKFYTLWNHKEEKMKTLWRAAIMKEFNTLHVDKMVWKIIQTNDMPDHKKAMSGRWVFAIKYGKLGEFIKCKARYVIKGYAQEFFGKTYSPTIARESVKMLAAVSARLNLKMFTFDCLSAYLNATLDDPEFMRIPLEFALLSKDFEGLNGCVLMVVKALYGMINAAKAWHETFAGAMAKFKFKGQKMKRLYSDRCVWVWRHKGHILLVGSHVDDTQCCTNSEALITAFLSHVRSCFPIQDLEPINYFLSIGYNQSLKKGTVELSQRGAIELMLEELKISNHKEIPFCASAKMQKSQSEATEAQRRKYLSGLGKTIYYGGYTYPETLYASSKLASYASNPDRSHKRQLEMWLLPFFRKGVKDHCIRYSRDYCIDGNDPALNNDGTIKDSACLDHFKPEIYVDANFVDQTENDVSKKSRGGTLVKLVNGPIFASSHMQSLTSNHTQQSEYIQANDGAMKGLQLVNFMSEIGFSLKGRIPIFEDNEACCSLATDHINNCKSKHISLRCHAIKELVIERGIFEIWKIPTDWQVADIFTKALDKRKFEKFDRMMRGLEMIDPKSKSRLITSTKGEQPTKSNDSAAEGECRKEVIMDLVFRVLRGDLVEGPRGKSLVVSPKGSRSVGY